MSRGLGGASWTVKEGSDSTYRIYTGQHWCLLGLGNSVEWIVMPPVEVVFRADGDSPDMVPISVPILWSRFQYGSLYEFRNSILRHYHILLGRPACFSSVIFTGLSSLDRSSCNEYSGVSIWGIIHMVWAKYSFQVLLLHLDPLGLNSPAAPACCFFGPPVNSMEHKKSLQQKMVLVSSLPGSPIIAQSFISEA